MFLSVFPSNCTEPCEGSGLEIVFVQFRDGCRAIVTVISAGGGSTSGMVRSHSDRTELEVPLLVVGIVGLVKQEVRGQLLVLVACKVCLDNEIALEPKATQALDSLALLLSY